MQPPWSEFLQLGAVVSAFFPQVRGRKGPVVEVTRTLAADPFFQALEFSGAEDRETQKELARILQASGKTVVFSGGTYCYQGQNNLHDLDEGRRQAALRNVQKIVDEASDYGCRVLYVMGFEAPRPQDRARALEQFSSSIAGLSEYARRKNPSAPLTVSVENFHILRETPFLIGPTADLGRMLRGLRSGAPNVGLTFDTSHILQLGEDLAGAYREVQDVIAHVHLSNCLIRDPSSPFYGDKHPPYGMAGTEIGVGELAAFLRLLKDAGHFSRTYPTGKPVLSLEVITPARQAPEAALEEAKEAFRRAWQEFSG